ncbi:MAG: rhodanese-like domain-containing protein [Vallitalea sp.]|jgi:rhodanese-related sulfurtransferase|nr:rhodanese-like domain-containing protein [Vallitalea sp.]
MYKYILLILLPVVLCSCTINDKPIKEEVADDIVQSVEEEGKEDMDKNKEVDEPEENEKPKYIKITPEEAKEMMVEGNIILDVRTQEEYNQGHIEGAKLLPVDSISAGKLEDLPNKDQIILVYCRSGNRSATATKALVNAGYTNVYDFGGIIDWPYEVVK